MSPQKHTPATTKTKESKQQIASMPTTTSSSLMLTAAGRAKRMYWQISVLDHMCSSAEKGRSAIIALRKAVVDVRQIRQQGAALAGAVAAWINRFGALRILYQAIIHISTCSEEIFEVPNNKLELEHLPLCKDASRAKELLIEVLALALVAAGTRSTWMENKLDWLNLLEDICSSQVEESESYWTYSSVIDILIACLSVHDDGEAVRFANALISFPRMSIMSFLERTMCGSRTYKHQGCLVNMQTKRQDKDVRGPSGTEFSAALALALISCNANNEFERNRYGCRRAASEVVANLLQRHLFVSWARFILDQYGPICGIVKESKVEEEEEEEATTDKCCSPPCTKAVSAVEHANKYPVRYCNLAIVCAYIFYEQCGGRQQQISAELCSEVSGMDGEDKSDKSNDDITHEAFLRDKSVHRRFARWLHSVSPPDELFRDNDHRTAAQTARHGFASTLTQPGWARKEDVVALHEAAQQLVTALR